MRNLKKLLYLNLYVDPSRGYMPNILKEMRELTYLYLPKSLHDKTKLELGNLVNLETLKNFHGNVSDLQDMTRLKTLSINTIRGQEGYTREALSSSLIKLTCLEKLTIRDYKNDDDDVGFVLNSIHLRQLKLLIYMPRLPDEKYFPSHLTTIRLQNCRLEEDPMPILEKLLHLKQLKFWVKAFCGKRMVCSKGGFPQLKELYLQGLEEWEEWIVEEGSMPLLHSLSIWDCGKLKELPDGMRFLTSLEDLDIYDTGEEWNKILYMPCHLTTIRLENCRLKEDPMPVLEKLLHLKEVRLSDRTFGGQRMVCSSGGFPRLQKLEMVRLKEWEEWIVEAGSMPLLNSLQIYSCPKLKELPEGLRFITSLKYLRINKMGEEWKKRLSEGGEDYYKVQHIPSVRFSDY